MQQTLSYGLLNDQKTHSDMCIYIIIQVDVQTYIVYQKDLHVYRMPINHACSII